MTYMYHIHVCHVFCILKYPGTCIQMWKRRAHAFKSFDFRRWFRFVWSQHFPILGTIPSDWNSGIHCICCQCHCLSRTAWWLWFCILGGFLSLFLSCCTQLKSFRHRGRLLWRPFLSTLLQIMFLSRLFSFHKRLQHIFSVLQRCQDSKGVHFLFSFAMYMGITRQTKLIPTLVAKFHCNVVLTLDTHRCSQCKTIRLVRGAIPTAVQCIVVRFAIRIVAVQTFSCGLALALDTR